MTRLVECVPNFSEGRDAAVVEAIAAAIASVDGVRLLDRQMDADHHRSVITFAGPCEPVAEAAFRGVAEAVSRIDLRKHSGVHPRIGAADVVPFVPLGGMTIAECVTLAVRVARRIAGELGVPVYLYGAAGRDTLAAIRRGPARAPDFGPPERHPTAGATAVGARGFLIAYNILLATGDVTVARRVARAVRASSGGLPGVQAMGVLLASRGLAQVSMNLTDFERTPVEAVYQAVRAEAARCGVSLAGGEIVGLVPRQAVDPGAEWWRQVEGFHAGQILENRLEKTAPSRSRLGN